MKLKARYLPYISLIAGILGLGIRTWLFLDGIDSRNLIVTSHPANALGYIVMALALGALFLMTKPIPESLPYQSLFRGGISSCVGSWVAALGILLTTFTEFSKVGGILGLLSCVLGVAAALSLAVTGIFRMRKKRPSYYFHAVLTVYLMVHILSQYQSWNIESQLQYYLPQLLASVFLMITAYHRTTLDADSGNTRQFLFFHYGALFFSCLAIGGTNPVFYFCMVIWTVTANLGMTAPKEPAPMVLPPQVKTCMDTLERNGFSAYVVGGCVRDHLLGLTPHDYDLCTNAKPEQICALFDSYTLVRSGEKHGTIGVVMDGTVYEITTYRTEGGYADSRHPDWVSFVDSIDEDLARRDFTVNAMAYSPTQGYADPFGGQKDLKAKILRAVGEPQERFREDALRILRGVRFAARMGLNPEEKTLDAMMQCAPLMDCLARERVFSELCGILPVISAEELIRYAPILIQVIPELGPCRDFRQNNPHHLYDVYTHTAHAVAAVPEEITLRMAALLHDIGKPETYTEDENAVGHFYGHEKRSAEMANDILLRLKAPTAMREQVVVLIENHMVLFQADKKHLRRRILKHGMQTVEQMLALQKADTVATGTRSGEELDHYAQIAYMLEEIRAEESCLDIRDLAIDGTDLIALGVPAGPRIGACLNHLLEQVAEEAIPNEKEPLLEAAKEFLR